MVFLVVNFHDLHKEISASGLLTDWVHQDFNHLVLLLISFATYFIFYFLIFLFFYLQPDWMTVKNNKEWDRYIGSQSFENSAPKSGKSV